MTAPIDAEAHLAEIARINAYFDGLSLVLVRDHRRFAKRQHPLQRVLDRLWHVAVRCVQGRRPDVADGSQGVGGQQGDLSCQGEDDALKRGGADRGCVGHSEISSGGLQPGEDGESAEGSRAAPPADPRA